MKSLLNLPHNTELAHLVRVEHSPDGKVWAHYFLSTDQEEIASWCLNMIDFFPGMMGSGRPIGANSGDKIIRITSLVAEAQLLLDK